jgi:protein involved in plasmid replication-relaxation
MTGRDNARYTYKRMTMTFASPPMKRLTPASDPRPFRFQDTDSFPRDLAILRFIARMGNASSDQIARAVGGSERGVRNRLKLLFDHRLVTRPRHQHFILGAFTDLGNRPLAYGLTTRGARLLAQHGERVNDKLDWTSKNAQRVPLTLVHTIEIAELLLAFDAACRANQGFQLLDQHQLLDYMPEATRASSNPFSCAVTVKLAQLDAPLDLTVIPDRLFNIVYPDNTRNSYALEADRGTMSVGTKRSRLIGKSTYRKKQIGYYHLWKQDLHAERWGFKKGFRVLTVTTSEARIQSMLKAQAEVAHNVPGLFLYSTPERLTIHGPFGPAWISCAEVGISLLPPSFQSTR